MNNKYPFEDSDILLRLDRDSGSLNIMEIIKLDNNLETKLLFTVKDDYNDESKSIEEIIGATILTYFSSICDYDIFKLEIYRNKKREMYLNYINELEKAASTGDADAKYNLAMSYVADFLKKRTRESLAMAEESMQDAANHGSSYALKFISEKWDKFKKLELR